MLAECRESGESVAAIARRYGLNDNLVHTWRRTLGDNGTPDFIRLPPPAGRSGTEVTVECEDALMRIELPTPRGAITVHWPMAEIECSVPWLRALMR